MKTERYPMQCGCRIELDYLPNPTKPLDRPWRDKLNRIYFQRSLHCGRKHAFTRRIAAQMIQVGRSSR